MEKKTIIAIVLSLVVVIGYYFIIQLVFPKRDAPPVSTTNTESTNRTTAPPGITGTREPAVTQTAPASSATETIEAGTIFSTRPRRVGENIPVSEEFAMIKTDVLEVTLTNAGGNIVSFKLLKHNDGGAYVDMILHGDAEPRAFGLAFGGRDSPLDTSLYNGQKISDTELQYSADYELQGKIVTLIKTYTFVPDEYMFKLSITINGGEAVPPLAFPSKDGNFAWTLSFGPQIGPQFKTLDGRQDYRNYLTSTNGKLKTQKVNASTDALVDSAISWAAIAGKYFTLIAIPDKTAYTYTFSMAPEERGLSSASRLFIERPPLNASVQTDIFYFYLGPKTSGELEIYDTNKSRLSNFEGYDLSAAANTSGFWAILNPLEWLLKQLLSLFYTIIPNYGVAIILVTLLVKLILFPLTKKQSEGTLRMQAIAPKIKELQDKYKDNPQKMNAEMGALYKKEGYNPLSGCLPMLIQIPIFFAMYNLFNNHFELRGAIFIPGWIPDLSLPEYILSFAPTKLPFLGWSELRVLPFIYVGSQLLYGKITQTPDQANNQQMKMMLYVLPIVFFFVLYNVPSGLLVYWIMSNVLQMIQQLIINKYLSKKKAEARHSIEDSAKKIIVPPKKRKRR
jgi:YidC/Oxa1 family membrane protein insertase